MRPINLQCFVVTKIIFSFNRNLRVDVIERIVGPVRCNNYIGKTNRNIITRMDKHGIKPDQLMYQHLTNCA